MINKDFLSRQYKFIGWLCLFSVILWAAHAYLLYQFASEREFYFPIWQIYLFHVIVTILFYTVVNFLYSSGKTNVLFKFMGATLVKMGLAIVFLLPLILSDFPGKQPDVFNFFIPYFLYLFFEIIFITKLLK